jgi:hypothetical protein
MSWNCIAAVEQEDHGGVVRPMVLTRASAGITHSAYVSKGDTIDFDGLEARVDMIRHKFCRPGDMKAPNSDAYVTFHRPLSDGEIDHLIKQGWHDLGGTP